MATESSPLSSAPRRKAGALTFAAIFSLESFVRSINATVVSLQAYDVLGTSQKVSILSTAVSLSVLLTTLSLPMLLLRLRRRQAYSLGVALMIGASLALATHSLTGQALGMYMRNSGAAVMNVTLSLYILDHIKRSELTRSEPLRLSLSTFSWMIGPALGVWLYTALGPAGPQVFSITAAAVLLAVFWNLRLADPLPPPPREASVSFGAIANVRRFIAQPRLRLAWTIAFGRSCFWSTFFIYGPLLVVESGLGKNVGGLMISASQALLLSTYLFGRIARSYGVRIVVALSFAVAAAASLAAGLAGVQAPYLAVGLLLVGSLATSALDGVGGIPYLRAVRPHERERMTPVYRTFIDFSELVPSFLFAFALLYFNIGAVFVIMGVGMAVVGVVAWHYLPKSM
jgi:MFS family permease